MGLRLACFGLHLAGRTSYGGVLRPSRAGSKYVYIYEGGLLKVLVRQKRNFYRRGSFPNLGGTALFSLPKSFAEDAAKPKAGMMVMLMPSMLISVTKKKGHETLRVYHDLVSCVIP